MNCSVFCLTETWLTPSYPDSLVQPEGFTLFRQDRDRDATGKTQGGGVCFLVNKRWCSDVRIVSRGCTTDLEYLTIKCRPHYLPREFSSVTMTAVYIHPAADTTVALGHLSDIISDYENHDPDTLSVVYGDFNSANLRTVMPNFIQHVSCTTRGNKTLDHCHSKVKSAYKSIERPGLGKSDHSVILLIPAYKQELKQSKPTQRTITLWPKSAIDTLHDCLESTDWNVFKSSDLDEYADTVTDYVKFCQEVCLPTKTITQYPNSKPWFSKVIRAKIVAKDNAETYRHAKRELKKAIREAKRSHRDRVEEKFQSGDSKALWSNINLITNYKGHSKTADPDDVTLPDRLNEFYARFDRDNNSQPSLAPRDDDDVTPLVITEHDVRRTFAAVKERKAAGPDGITPRLVKTCSAQLAAVFTDIFNLSLRLCVVPSCFKRATIIPVPKKNNVSCLNDYRPVAITSIFMKCFEKRILPFLKSLLPSDFDCFQFAYKSSRSIEDAISINLHEVLNHLETRNSYVRILFIDYSSAFNTIIPEKLHSKLVSSLKLPVWFCNWILDFLLNRTQVVKIGKNVSSELTLNTGTPQGCPLSPKLYSIFTYDCCAQNDDSLLVKFADDTTNTGCISNNDESNYRSEVDSIVNWSQDNNLILNVSKTKEMIIDFRRNKTPMIPLEINGSTVEQVSSFKFLGTHISDDLKWTVNSAEILKKAKQRLYFLRKLKLFGANQVILINFYRTIIESIITSSIIVWFGRVNQADLNKLSSVIRSAEKIIGTGLPSLHSIYVERSVSKTNNIIKDSSHPAHKYFQFLPSQRRMRTFKGNKRFTKSFYPEAVKMFNC